MMAEQTEPARKTYLVGRMGITETEKRPGDKVWCPRSREWKAIT